MTTTFTQVATRPAHRLRVEPALLRPAVIDPLTDDLWVRFAATHPSAVAFHQRGWIDALARAFGYRPRFHVLQNGNGDIVASWPLMLVRSRLTGTRLVCLPFCHSAGPLLDSDDQAERLMAAVTRDANDLRVGGIETRAWPRAVSTPHGLTSATYYSRHVIDLSGGLEVVMSHLSKDMRYSIRKARRNGVKVRLGDRPGDFDCFYRLYLDQRRRQGLLPQPRDFIEAIFHNMVSTGAGFIVVAESEERPICALLSVSHGDTVVGTHSGSDGSARRLRATPLAMWRSIEIACERGHAFCDLGRSDVDSTGLQQFKDEWGAVREDLPYFYYPHPAGLNLGKPKGLSKRGLDLFGRFAPEPVFVGLGTALYRHLG